MSESLIHAQLLTSKHKYCDIFIDNNNIYNPEKQDLISKTVEFITCTICHGCVKEKEDGNICIQCDNQIVCSKCL